MSPDPDYSAAYVRVITSAPELVGHGFVFTIGRGNEIEAAAISALAHLVVGLDVESVVADLGGFARSLTGDSQLRWLGPEKGVMHMAIGAVINAVWDLAARLANKPVWRLIADMTPEQIIELIDFRYLTDALTPDEALEILRRAEPTKSDRISDLIARGYPRLHDDARLARLFGREDGAVGGRGGSRGVPHHQAQSRSGPGRRPATAQTCARQR